MNNQLPKNYDLEERTAAFAENIIDYCIDMPKNTITTPIISQLIRAATSIGANYCEANGASSPKDFNNKVCICKKETREVKFWLRMMEKIRVKEPKLEALDRENHELLLIFSKIDRTISSAEK